MVVQLDFATNDQKADAAAFIACLVTNGTRFHAVQEYDTLTITIKRG